MNFYAGINPEIEPSPEDMDNIRKKIDELDNEKAMDFLRREWEAVFLIFIGGGNCLCQPIHDAFLSKISDAYDGSKKYMINLGSISYIPYYYQKSFIRGCFTRLEDL